MVRRQERTFSFTYRSAVHNFFDRVLAKFVLVVFRIEFLECRAPEEFLATARVATAKRTSAKRQRRLVRVMNTPVVCSIHVLVDFGDWNVHIELEEKDGARYEGDEDTKGLRWREDSKPVT